MKIKNKSPSFKKKSIKTKNKKLIVKPKKKEFLCLQHLKKSVR